MRKRNSSTRLCTNRNMKLKLSKVIFTNLLFRIFLLIYLLKEERRETPRNVKPLKHWMDPISKRVILIFINGLDKNFLWQNSTPYLKEMLENYGTFGVAYTGYLQTNYQGIRTVLTGKISPGFPFSWMDSHCPDSILDYGTFSCGMGKLPADLSWKCYIPDEYPLTNFRKFPGLFEVAKGKSSLYVMSIDLDPVLLQDYQSRLKKIDEDIRFFATILDNFHGDNKTTYIVTSARGSPVGNSLSLDAPVVVWGQGFEQFSEVTYITQTDITAMLCALLGISFPSGMFGLIPMRMMDLQDHYEFELTLYMIRHFERVLEIVDLRDHVYDSTELEMEQLSTRLQIILFKLRKAKLVKWSLTCFSLILLLTIWGVNLTSFASSGFACFFFHLKSLFLLLIAVGATLSYGLLGLELLVALEILLFCTLQNRKVIFEAIAKYACAIFQVAFVTFTIAIVVGLIGNSIMIPLLLIPVILWPLYDGSYIKLNRYVLATRLLSGFVLGALPQSRVFGEMPHRETLACVSAIFLFNLYFFHHIFNRRFDTHTKANFLMIFGTVIHVYYIREYHSFTIRNGISCFFLAFSLLSAYAASGKLVEKFIKTLTPLFIPVLMMAVRVETIFFLSVFFNAFSWIFTEYHNSNENQYQFHPAVFTVEPKPRKSFIYSDEDLRLTAFFVIYIYVCYFAIGHFPDLHSYDLYVLPEFVFQYPKMVSYFLGGFKFFLPFFIVTTSFLTLCTVTERRIKPKLLVALWVSDLIGSFLIFNSQLLNRLFNRTILPAKFSYFVIQQFAAVSVILSYFLAKHLLLNPEKLLPKYFQSEDVIEKS